MRSSVTTLCALVLVGCGGSEQSSPSAPHGLHPLDAHAADVLDAHRTVLIRAESARQTVADPPAFLTIFTTQHPDLLTRSVSTPAEIERNQHITERWQSMYCTDALQATMKAHGIFMSSAQLVHAANGTKHSVASCVARSERTPPTDSFPDIKDAGPFTTSQICKAALGLVYDRDPAIMRTLEHRDHVQVQYERPSDGREYSYRCRLEGDLVLSWDDSLAGARWYGSAPGDTQLRFEVRDGRLTVQDIIKGAVANEKKYAPSELKL